ncbi:MAG: DUF5615 family PIN-like protein [Holophagaceae bacterium]
MSLLLDQNLSRKLLGSLTAAFPGSTHVLDCALSSASDQQIWDHARQHGLTILSKDTDFVALLALRGFPPKVIWLKSGNGPSAAVARLLLGHQKDIEAFLADPNSGLLELH